MLEIYDISANTAMSTLVDIAVYVYLGGYTHICQHQGTWYYTSLEMHICQTLSPHSVLQ